MGRSHDVEEEVVLTQPTYGGGDGCDGGVGYDYDYGGGGSYANDYHEEGGYRDDNNGSEDDAANDVSYGLGEDEVAVDDGSGDDAVDDDVTDEDDLSDEEGFGNARATNSFDLEVAGDNQIYDDEMAYDSDDDRPLRALSAREIAIIRDLMLDSDLVSEFEDLNHCHRAVADGGPSESTVLDAAACTIIRKGILFPTMDHLKTWLQEYSIVHNRPYRVINSHKDRRYMVGCEEPQCGWKVCARKTKVGQWRITSVKQPHVCATAEAEDTHLQLNSRFIARQLCPVVKHMPSITVSALIEIIFKL
jgi:hypothetical protein